MIQEAADRLTRYLRDKIGQGLRTVLVVQPDEYQIIYLRDSLRREYSRETFSEVVDSFRLEQPLFNPGIEEMPVGERRAIVHYHENAFVLQFPFSETEYILVSVRPEIGRDLLGFIDHCRQLVHERPE